MKKSLVILFVLSLVFSACEGPEGPQGIPGKDGYEGYWNSIPFEVGENEWQLAYGGANKTNPYYYCEKRASDIDEDMYEFGNVTGYVFLYNNGKESQTQLPYVLAAENESGQVYDWIEITHMEYEIGKVRFIVTYNDFNTTYRPGHMYFRVVLTD